MTERAAEVHPGGNLLKPFILHGADRPEADGPQARDDDRPDERAVRDLERLWGIEAHEVPPTDTEAALSRLQPLFLVLAWGALAVMVAAAGVSAGRHALREEQPAERGAFAVIDGIRFNDEYALASDGVTTVWATSPDPRTRPPGAADNHSVATLVGDEGAVVLGSAERNTRGFVPVLLPAGATPAGAPTPPAGPTAGSRRAS